MSTATLTGSTTGRPVRPLGIACLAGGLIGAAQGVVLALWQPQVGTEWYSYPLTPTGHVVAQVSFALQHLLLIAGLVALTRLPMISRNPAGRIGAAAAVAGMVLLTIQELVAITAKDVLADSSRATLVSSLYGIPTILIGAGLIVAGVTAMRAEPALRRDPWLPGLVLATGVYVFVALTPSLMGSFVAARLGIIGWMLLFAALGWRESARSA